MDKKEATKIMLEYLAREEVRIGEALGIAHGEQSSQIEGWVFYYNSRAYIESNDYRDCLVGQGPTIVLSNGTILQGGSIENVEMVLRRFGIIH